MTNYNFVSKSALLAFTSILLKFFGLLSMVFIQRYFGYEIIGIIALSVSLLSMINIFSDLGLETTHRKIFNSSGINKEISISTFTIIKFTLSFVILICTLIFLYFYRHNKEFFSSDLIFLFIFFTSIRFFIDNIISILKNIYYADLEVSTVSRTRLIFRFFQSLSKIAIAFFGFSAIYLVHLEIFFGLLIVSTLVIFLKNFNFKIPNIDYFRMYFKLSLSVTIISIFITLLTFSDRIMINYFHGVEDLGVYYLPFTFLAFYLLISNSLGTLFLPLSTKLLASNKKNQLQVTLDNVSKNMSLILSPPTIIGIVFSNEILQILFGEEGIQSAKVMQFLLLTFFLMALRAPYQIILIAFNKTREISYVLFLILILNLTLNVFLIPSELFGYKLMGLSYYGASITTLISYIFLFFISSLLLRRLVGITQYSYLIYHFISMLVTVSVLLFLRARMDFYDIHFLFYAPLAPILFYTLLIKLKVLDKKDLYQIYKFFASHLSSAKEIDNK